MERHSFIFKRLAHISVRDAEMEPGHHIKETPYILAWDSPVTLSRTVSRLFMCASQGFSLHLVVCKTYLQQMNRNVQVQCSSRSIL